MVAKRGDRAADIISRDRKVMINTTRESYNFVPDHGKGDYVWDVNGKRLIDFSSFISVYNLGVNSTDEVRGAIKSQMDKLMHSAFTDFYAERPVEFAELLISLMPKGFGRVFFSNSGTEANEAAIKFAKLFTRRSYTFAFYGAFHGRTKGSLALTASRSVQRAFNGPFPDVIHVPFPYCYRCPLKQTYPDCGFACIDYIREYPFKKEVNPKEVSAFIAEPIQGEGGYIVPPQGYFKELRKLLDEHGILLIADEVQSGYMRTGRFLAMDNFGVEADIYTMAKSIGAGLPLGVTVSRKSLGNIESGAHANTFGGNLAVIAGAYAQLSYVKRNLSKMRSGIIRKGRYAMERMEELKERYEIVGDVRGIGLMLAIELVNNKSDKVPIPDVRERILEHAFERGLLLLPAGESTIRIIPPLNISDDALEKGFDILEESIGRYSGR